MSKFSGEKLWREELSAGRGNSHFLVAKRGNTKLSSEACGGEESSRDMFPKSKTPKAGWGYSSVAESLLTYHG